MGYSFFFFFFDTWEMEDSNTHHFSKNGGLLPLKQDCGSNELLFLKATKCTPSQTMHFKIIYPYGFLARIIFQFFTCKFQWNFSDFSFFHCISNQPLIFLMLIICKSSIYYFAFFLVFSRKPITIKCEFQMMLEQFFLLKKWPVLHLPLQAPILIPFKYTILITQQRIYFLSSSPVTSMAHCLMPSPWL